MRIRTILPVVLFAFASSVPLHPQNVDKAWTILKQGAGDQSPERRAKVFRAIALIVRNPAAQQLAENALTDEKANVRIAAASALGQMEAKGSVPKLQQIVREDRDAGVVFAAADALFRLADPSAFQIYYAVLMGEKKTGEGLVDSQMKMLRDPKAMASVGFQVGIGFIPFGSAGYGVFKAVAKDDASPIRAAAATKLAGDPDPKSGQALAKSAADPKWIVRAAAVDAIAKRGDPSLLKAIIPLLNDENDAVKYSAAATVIRLSVVQK
jgi:HEAT repeat protein